MKPYIIPFEELKNKDVDLVGGKNASIGEMISGLASLGVSVPGGFATTSHAYRDFLAQDRLDERIRSALASLDVDDVERLAVVGREIRGWMLATPFPARLNDEVLDAWRKMGHGSEFAVAVRSSATAEDLPEASFAGQQETFLNVRGEDHLLSSMHEVYASLFNDRAISYRVHSNFDHNAVALSVGVQHMVRSDRGSAGVMFTLDTDSGFRDVVFITAAYGLGETVVQGAVNPDEFYVYKPALRAGRRILRFTLKARSKVLTSGRSIGQRIGAGSARIIKDAKEMSRVRAGDVLVADMTDPDWEPVMKRASAIVTNRGGRTCHAAIIARELGIPAVVGCGTATTAVKEGQAVTVSCAEGDTGHVYEGMLEYDQRTIEMDAMPAIPVKITMNVGNPDRAFDFAGIPHKGVGLARLEFIINRMIGVHPRALLEFDKQSPEIKDAIGKQIAGYDGPVNFYVDKLAEGIGQIAAAFAPEPVIVRLSDFKSNEYANLIGGKNYEPHEENPMLGFRGASRYIDKVFRPCFELECRALKRVRDEMGLTNVQIMVPFVRTLLEAKTVTDLLAENGLKRGENGLKHIMMCELPTNALLADQYLEFFDGMSIGSNDMTQLTLGLDRDSSVVAKSFDERDDAVKALMAMAIKAWKAQNKYVGICGQGPSDHPELARWLVEQGIDSLSLNPDTVVETWMFLAGDTPAANAGVVTPGAAKPIVT